MHKFFSQYKWDEKQYKATSFWLLKELEAIMEEGANSLDKYIDYDEVKGLKNLLRSQGVTDESMNSGESES